MEEKRKLSFPKKIITWLIGLISIAGFILVAFILLFYWPKSPLEHMIGFIIWIAIPIILFSTICLSVMFKMLNKSLSIPIAIGLIFTVILASLAFWQYSEIEDENFGEEEPEIGEEIKPYIKIISPNGGEKLVIGDVYTITWDFSGVDKIDIGYRREGSGAEINGWVGKNISAPKGNYLWTITEEVFPGPEYKKGSFELIIQETPFRAGLSKTDRSDSQFTITRENEISDWEIYRNEEYGFEIKYPEHLLLYSPLKTYSVEYVTSSNSYTGIKFGEFNNGCSLNIFKTDRNENINPFDETDISIKMRKYAVSEKLDSENETYHFGMSVVSHAVSPEECKSLLEKIIMTFKFLD